MKIVERQPLVINDIAIHERAFDGYVNATAMCQAGGKQLKHFFENDRTKLFLRALERSVGIPTNLLVQSTVKGKNETRGTWVHPRVAISLAMWISPDFEVRGGTKTPIFFSNILFFQLFGGGTKPLIELRGVCDNPPQTLMVIQRGLLSRLSQGLRRA